MAYHLAKHSQDVLSKQDGTVILAEPIRDAIDRLINAVHMQQPTPIVDVARETTKVVLTEWIGHSARGKDLGKDIGSIPKDRELLRWASCLVNRLHPRGKSAEIETRAELGVRLRPLVDQDAETSIHLVGFVLREIRWAKP